MSECIRTEEYPIYLGEDALEELNAYLKIQSFSKAFILVDENTKAHCYGRLIEKVPSLEKAQLIEIKSGEAQKHLETCTQIWDQLTNAAADRKSLLVNLGGGVISDMGGFAAKTYKRGMFFINVPTTLLSQVDASIGGKLAVDFKGFKNHIGLFGFPNMIIVDPSFLKTLEPRELRSGFGEVIKHGLIQSKAYWDSIQDWNSLEDIEWNFTISKSISIKKKVVDIDPFENGLRKALNFGHTLGHALETFYLDGSHHLLHGEAIAIGMILEAYLSLKKGVLSATDFELIQSYILRFFPKVELVDLDWNQIEALLLQDKKNSNGVVSFTLLNGIGDVLIDQQIETSLLLESIEYYKAL